MFVKKFEADTLEEALKAVKQELGPDAIIIKTTTNNGLKGAFKKKRIEITAAISENNYEKKAKVDKVLNHEQKESFYQKPASVIKDTISKYNSSETTPGYGQIGLNKVVNTIAKGSSSISEITSKTSAILKESLDDFLSDDDNQDYENDSSDESLIRENKSKVTRGKYADPPLTKNQIHDDKFLKNKNFSVEDQLAARLSNDGPKQGFISKDAYNELRQELRTTQHKMELLEKKIADLTQNFQFNHKYTNETHGLFQLRTTLRTLDVDESIIIELIKKAGYELSKPELDDPDIVFEFALKEMASSISTDIPLFAKLDSKEPVITALFSETSSGQSSMGMKIAVLKKDVIIIQHSTDATNHSSTDFAAQVFGIQVSKVQTFSDVIGLTRKSIENGKSVLLDIKLNNKNTDETKKFIESLKRGFLHVEVLCTISAIHSELYNRKIIARYKDLIDGVIISHVDQCLNFGAIFNVHKTHNRLPLKFFGTGPVIPDDLEGATSERVMSGLFQF